MAFGVGPFGVERFGDVDWFEHALWDNVPGEFQRLDTDDYLKLLLQAFGETLEVLRKNIADIPYQRDPILMQSGEEDKESFLVPIDSFPTDSVINYDTGITGDGVSSDYSGSGNSALFPVPVVPGSVVLAAGSVTFTDNGYGVLTGSGGSGGYGNIHYETGEWRIHVNAPGDFVSGNVIAGYQVYKSRTFFRENDENYGYVVKVVGKSGVLLERIGVSWQGVYNGQSYTVVNVRSRLDVPELWFSSEDDFVVPRVWAVLAERTGVKGDGRTSSYNIQLANWPVQSFSSVFSLVAGIVTFTDNGDGTLIGSGGSGGSGTIDYMTGAVSIVLNDPLDFAGNVEAIVNYETLAEYKFDLKPISLLDYFAQDFGFANDKSDPVAVQRSIIANLVKYFGLKATQDSYRIRGEISGFNVFVHGLYLVEDYDVISELPSSHIFYDASTGQYYTDIEPRMIKFDDISSDVVYNIENEHTGIFGGGVSPYSLQLLEYPLVPGSVSIVAGLVTFTDPAGDGVLTGSGGSGGSGTVDYQTGNVSLSFNNDADFGSGDEALASYGVPILDNAYMYEDLSPDGMSVGLAFAIDVFQNKLVIDAVEELDEDDLRNYELSSGRRVVLGGITQDMFDVFSFRRGVFGFTVGYPAKLNDTVYWIDFSESYDSVNEKWTVIVGGEFTITGMPADGALRYWPEVSFQCGYCRSYRVVIDIEATSKAFEYYGDESSVLDAVDRLKVKLGDILRPIHVEVIDTRVSLPVSYAGSSFHFSFSVV